MEIDVAPNNGDMPNPKFDPSTIGGQPLIRLKMNGEIIAILSIMPHDWEGEEVPSLPVIAPSGLLC